MQIFLDTRDLINLLERAQPCDVTRFRGWLAGGDHSIVVSSTVIFELAAPLVHQKRKSSITSLLNDLESLSPKYIADGFIAPMEIREAIDAFTHDREYMRVKPYVPRFDEAIAVFGPPPTRMYLHFPLAEIVWTIAQEAPNALQEKPERLRRLRQMLVDDRRIAASISVREFFGTKLGRDLRLYGIQEPPGGVSALAEWIYETPRRCPALRLDYEVYHQIRINIGDLGQLQDFEDLANVKCLPYVDLATLDRRMAGYVRQVTRKWPEPIGERVRHDLSEILDDTSGNAV